jgi:cytochrome oxidase Cu insertion factor (SCO1/SenC/PrrC family)
MTRSMLLASAALTTLLWQPSAAQQSGIARTPIDVAKLGPQVGQLVPDFSLKDQNGKTWTRQSILGPRGAMLVFFRSADW